MEERPDISTEISKEMEYSMDEFEKELNKKEESNQQNLFWKTD